MDQFERNQTILRMYREGHRQFALAEKFGLTQQRVGQILQMYGITKMDQVATEKKIPLPARLPESHKLAVEELAYNDGISASQWIANLVAKELEQRNYQFKAKVPLEQMGKLSD